MGQCEPGARSASEANRRCNLDAGILGECLGSKLRKCSSVVKPTRRKFGLKQDRLKGPKINGLE